MEYDLTNGTIGLISSYGSYHEEHLIDDAIDEHIFSVFAEAAHINNDGTWNVQSSHQSWFGDEYPIQFEPDILMEWNFTISGTYNINTDYIVSSAEPVPEPSTIALMSIGIVGLLGGAAKKKFKAKNSNHI